MESVDVTKTMNSHQIDTRTALYCVIGHPVAHSLSPAMHNRAFAARDCNAAYVAFDVEDIGTAVKGLRALGIQGASITLPHKVAVMGELDEIHETARAMGAVNTIVNRNGRLCGFNTDGAGAVAALQEKTKVAGKRVALLGAGGAARAVGFGLVEAGAKVTIFNRTRSKAEKLAHELKSDGFETEAFRADSFNVLINATSLGMHPYWQIMPVSAERLAPHLLVMDIVYNPLETRLLKAARQKGCQIQDGVAMFVHQGAIQFELWTGQSAPVGLMRAMVIEQLGPVEAG
jgi:shikimate dehydrogenase